MRRLLPVLGVLLLLTAPASAQDPVPSLLPLPPGPSAGPDLGGRGPDVVPRRGAGVVVVGVAGLRWDDVGPRTPTLRRLATTAAVGVLSVKARPAVSCAADGWLTLGAGTRADAFRDGTGPCQPGLRLGGDVLERNAGTVDAARVGALAAALDGAVEAVGDGARLAVLDQGRAGAPVVLVDGGTLDARTLDTRTLDARTLDAGDRDAGLALADAIVARALERLPAAADLIVVGLSEATGESEPRLHAALASGPSFPRGALRSASTRRAPYVQLIDVAPTVLSVLGEQVPEVMDGQPWTVSGPAPSVAELVDLDRRAQGQREATVPFFVVLLAVLLLLLAVLHRRPRAAEIVALAGTAALGASYLANLVPWWRVEVPLLGLLAVVVPLALAAALLALVVASSWSTRRRRPHDDDEQPPGVVEQSVAGPAQLVCGVVAAVLLVDLVTGAHLQMSSVAGYSPLVAGRFAGIGNVAFGVLAAAVLLAAGASRRALVIGAVGLLAVVVDGAPTFGSDVGGVLALVPAFVVLGLLRTGTRVTLTRLALAGGAAAALVTVFALADWSRPARDRTHLGRFVQDVVDGTAGDLLSRKASAVLDLLFRSPVTALLPVVVAGAVYLVARPPAPLARAFALAPGWRHGLVAVGLASALGFALNDSGAAVPALAIGVALPATIAVVLRARRADAVGALPTTGARAE